MGCLEVLSGPIEAELVAAGLDRSRYSAVLSYICHDIHMPFRLVFNRLKLTR